MTKFKFKPMLATTFDPSKIHPENFYVVSPKLDGVRVVVSNDGVFTRSMKQLPNKQIAETLAKWAKKCVSGFWFDGEIIVGEPTNPMCYRNTVSLAMSQDKISDKWRFCVFDCIDPCALVKEGAWARWLTLCDIAHPSNTVKIVPHWLEKGCKVKEKCSRLLELGYEGAMISPDFAYYKYGRATHKSMELMKFKTSADAEGEIVGFTQKLHNNNTAMTNELGYASRSLHRVNMVPVEALGSLIVKLNGVEFEIGTGFTEAERCDIWANRQVYLGQLVKFKYQDFGAYEKPRCPVYLGLRDKKDL